MSGLASHGKNNVFVIGLNEFNRAKLEATRAGERCAFHGLLDPREILDADSYPVEDMLRRAEQQLEAFGGRIDAIVGYMDFPVSTILPLLARRFGLRSVSLEALLKCEHKYWSRLEQGRAIPDHIPSFSAFNPFDGDALQQVGMDFPFWIKPIKSAGSWLGFKINDRRDFEAATAEIRENIGRFADPFNYILRQAELPDEVRSVGGSWCIAEELLSGRQATLEGAVFNGRVEVHGVVDSVREPNRVSFNRYQYPSCLPKAVRQRMHEIAERALKRVGFDNAAFNIEFFWNKSRDKLWLLEINTRIAQHHSDLFQKVDGVSNHEVMIDVALGAEPRLPKREGPYNCAAACWLRRYEDGVVRRVPGEDEVAALQRRMPGLVFEPHVEPGQRLSDLVDQDSYSYVLALIYLGAADPRQLLARFRQCAEALEFEFAAPDASPAPAS